jgi:hypothetical protein
LTDFGVRLMATPAIIVANISFYASKAFRT